MSKISSRPSFYALFFGFLLVNLPRAGAQSCQADLDACHSSNAQSQQTCSVRRYGACQETHAFAEQNCLNNFDACGDDSSCSITYDGCQSIAQQEYLTCFNMVDTLCDYSEFDAQCQVTYEECQANAPPTGPGGGGPTPGFSCQQVYDDCQSGLLIAYRCCIAYLGSNVASNACESERAQSGGKCNSGLAQATVNQCTNAACCDSAFQSATHVSKDQAIIFETACTQPTQAQLNAYRAVHPNSPVKLRRALVIDSGKESQSTKRKRVGGGMRAKLADL